MGIDLGGLFKAKKQEKPKQPEVGALIVPESEALPQIIEVLKGAGFNTEQQDKLASSIIFSQIEKQEEGDLYKVSDHLAVVLHGVDLSVGLEGDKIKALKEEHGYYPNAFDVSELIRKSFEEAIAADDKDAVSKAEKDFKDTQTYVLSVAKAVPASVTKAEKKIVQVLKNYGEQKKLDDEMKAKAKKDAEAAATQKAEDEAKAKSVAEKGEDFKKIADMFTALTTKFDGLVAKQEQLGKDMDTKIAAAVGPVIKEVAAVQKSVKEKFGQTLIGSDHGNNHDDLSGRRTARKNEGDHERAIDTAFMKRTYDAKSRTFKYDGLN